MLLHIMSELNARVFGRASDRSLAIEPPDGVVEMPSAGHMCIHLSTVTGGEKPSAGLRRAICAAQPPLF